MHSHHSTEHRSPKRDTGWKRDGKAKGVYWRRRANGSKAWGFYADGRIQSTATRQDALDQKAKAGLRKSAGLPAPDTRVTMLELTEEVREIKRRKLRASSFAALEFALNKILLPELGHLKPSQCGPDRIARLVRDLEERGLQPATIRRYLSPLSAVFGLAVRRGIIPMSPMALLSEDERPTGGGLKDHYIWSPEEISTLISSAEKLAKRDSALYDYSGLIHLLALTGLRVGEALALRKCDVDLLAGELRVEQTGGRGEIGAPKTEAGKRTVPLGPGLVELLAEIIDVEAPAESFVFHAKGKPDRPLSYWNFRERGFNLALEEAGLAGKGITIHALRSAAASLLAARGLTAIEVAEVLGHADANITLRVYSKIFDKRDVAARVRDAQGSIFETETP
jgi:integrase